MIKTKHDLINYICEDSKNYQSQIGITNRLRCNFFSNTINDQKYIWKYIKTLRYLEYHTNNNAIHNKILTKYYLYKLRKYGYKTGFQIPPNTVGKGLTIWHWGPIIISPHAQIGQNCTLNPMVVIGHKNHKGKAPVIGDNVFIGGGSYIIGPVTIGNNVIIGQNVVVTKDIRDNSVIVSQTYREIK